MIDQILHIDYLLFDFINQKLSNTLFDSIMPIIRNKNTWIPFYLLGVLGIIKYKKKLSVYIILAAIAVIGIADGISSHVMKPFFERTRPCLLEEFSGHVNLVVEKCSGAFSFPSSHAANHFALAIFLVLVVFNNSKVGAIILIIWAFLIGFAQIYVGVHFPSDVLVGAILGSVIGTIVAGIYHLLIRKYSSRLS